MPYTEPSISENRFLKDVPSGVREEIKNATVGGIPGVVFESRDIFLGDTFEVWFIYNGHLYEVTTLRD